MNAQVDSTPVQLLRAVRTVGGRFDGPGVLCPLSLWVERGGKAHLSTWGSGYPAVLTVLGLAGGFDSELGQAS